MRTFRLPDLGEGLEEVELVEFHVSAGDRVVADQPLLSVETAKAVVEVPSPFSGRVLRLIGAPGEIIKVGAVVAEFEDESVAPTDAGTVVGELPQEPAARPKIEPQPASPPVLVSPAIRKLAHDRAVDLAGIRGSGPGGAILRRDVEAAAPAKAAASDGFEPLRGVRRVMAENMARSAAEVPGSTVTDEVDISSWPQGADITARLVEAIVVACRAEPALNAWYDPQRKARKLHKEIDLGIALDTADGLFVPVLRGAAHLGPAEIRARLEAMKLAVGARKAAASDLSGQTITLSNFGMRGGLFASLAIAPPQVAIVGAGRIADVVRALDGQPRITRMLPLSLTFDHRVVTGGEAVRFLNALRHDLSTASSGRTAEAETS
jgi:pyruvate dehydrogenase E2 component (dihydrolipoamide acetyltransferase)